MQAVMANNHIKLYSGNTLRTVLKRTVMEKGDLAAVIANVLQLEEIRNARNPSVQIHNDERNLHVTKAKHNRRSRSPKVTEKGH